MHSEHYQNMQFGEVVRTDFTQIEDITLQLGCNKIIFERPQESSSEHSEEEECNRRISTISTNDDGMRLTINESHCSKFEFYDQKCGESVVTVSKRGLDLHCNNIKNVDDPSCEKDAVNKRYVDNFFANFRSGLVYLGDISSRSGNLNVSGALQSSVVMPGFGSGDCIVQVNYNCSGYTPIVQITLQNPVGGVNISDMTPPTLIDVTDTYFTLYLRELTSAVQNCTIHVLMSNPNMSYGPY